MSMYKYNFKKIAEAITAIAGFSPNRYDTEEGVETPLYFGDRYTYHDDNSLNIGRRESTPMENNGSILSNFDMDYDVKIFNQRVAEDSKTITQIAAMGSMEKEDNGQLAIFGMMVRADQDVKDKLPTFYPTLSNLILGGKIHNFSYKILEDKSRSIDEQIKENQRIGKSLGTFFADEEIYTRGKSLGENPNISISSLSYYLPEEDGNDYLNYNIAYMDDSKSSLVVSQTSFFSNDKNYAQAVLAEYDTENDTLAIAYKQYAIKGSKLLIRTRRHNLSYTRAINSDLFDSYLQAATYTEEGLTIPEYYFDVEEEIYDLPKDYKFSDGFSRVLEHNKGKVFKKEKNDK